MSRPLTVLMMAISVAILFGTLSRDWATGSGMSAAPAGFEACIGSVCHAVADDAAPRDLVLLKWISMFGGLLSAIAIAFGAHRLRSELPVPLAPAMLVFCATLVAMVAFELRAIHAFDGSPGSGCLIAIGGLIAATITVFLVSRRP